MRPRSLFIIELEEHAEVLGRFLGQLNLDLWELEVLVVKSVFDELSDHDERIHWHVVEDNVNVETCLTDCFETMRNTSLAVLMSGQRHVKEYAQFDFPVPLLFCVHNVNFSLNRGNWHVEFDNLIEFQKACTYFLFSGLLRRELFFRRWAVQKPGVFVTSIGSLLIPALGSAVGPGRVGPTLYDENPRKCPTPDEEKHPERRNVFRVVVPGMVDVKRKDYQIVFQALERVAQEKDGKAVELVLLGANTSIRGRILVWRFEERLKLLGVNVVQFKNRLSSLEFDQFLASADLIIAPIKLGIRYKLWREVYGQTKLSGAEFDAFKAHVPFLIPSSYSPSASRTSLIAYDSLEDLVRLIHDYRLGRERFDLEGTAPLKNQWEDGFFDWLQSLKGKTSIRG
jgi:hypothetical protein